MAREVRCHQTDRRTDRQTHTTTTVTLAAHARRGLMSGNNGSKWFGLWQHNGLYQYENEKGNARSYVEFCSFTSYS